MQRAEMLRHVSALLYLRASTPNRWQSAERRVTPMLALAHVPHLSGDEAVHRRLVGAMVVAVGEFVHVVL